MANKLPLGQPFTINRQSPQAAGLALWLPPPELTNPVKDLVSGLSFSNTASAGSPTHVTDPKFGVVREYTSNNERLQSSTIASGFPLGLTYSSAMAFSYWVKYYSVNHWGCNIYVGDFTSGYYWYHGIEVNGSPYMEWGGNAWDYTFTFPTGTWCHVVIQKGSGTSNVSSQYYANGQLRINSSSMAVENPASGVDWWFDFGCDPGRWNESIDGRMTDIRIYRKQLSQSEVNAIYTNPWDLYEPVAPPKFWSVPWYYRSSSSSIHVYLEGATTGTSTSDTQSIYLKGSASTTDTQPIYLKGSSTSSDTQPIYLKGQSTATDTQPVYLKGYSTTTDSQPIYLTGYITISDSQPIYLNSSGATTDDTQPIYLKGEISISDNQAIYLKGQSTSTDTQPVYLKGTESSSDNQPIYLKGYSTTADNQPIYLIGQNTSADNQPIYLAGKSASEDNQPIYLAGSLSVTDNQTLYLKGSSTASDNQSIYLAGLTYFPFTDNFTGSNDDPWNVGKWLTEAN